jgi:hypothetical protein
MRRIGTIGLPNESGNPASLEWSIAYRRMMASKPLLEGAPAPLKRKELIHAAALYIAVVAFVTWALTSF